MKRSLRVAASVLSADFGRLAEEVASVEAAGADIIHVDAMDGHFVPNLSMGPRIVSAVRAATKLPIEAHLMIYEPDRYIEQFADVGTDALIIHLEASVHPQRTLENIHKLGKRAGIALSPHSPEEAVRYLMEDVDTILVMTVNPGFAGQKFIEEVLPKIGAVRRRIDEGQLQIQLGVDGGITSETAKEVLAKGADFVVAATAVFRETDRRRAIDNLRGLSKA